MPTCWFVDLFSCNSTPVFINSGSQLSTSFAQVEEFSAFLGIFGTGEFVNYSLGFAIDGGTDFPCFPCELASVSGGSFTDPTIFTALLTCFVAIF